ncbi:MAG: hypothetical protein R2831_02565 [Chitinophagaceae bacterium]
MKQIIIFLLLFIVTQLNASILRVNNNPGITGVHTTLLSAVNAAASGDTIYLEPSSINYNGLTISKKITLIGNGSQLDTFFNLQAIPKTATIAGSLKFKGHNADGSYISVHAQDNLILDTTDNVIVANSFFERGLTIRASNFLHIHQSYFGLFALLNSTITSSNHVLFENCLLNLELNCIASSDIKFVRCNLRLDVSDFTNASFISSIITANDAVTLNSCTGFANIIQNTPYISEFSGSVKTESTILSLNEIFVDPNPTFNNTNPFPAQELTAKAKNLDVGIFSGNKPIKLGTLPSFPSIYELQVPSYINTNDIIINLSTRSNN